MDGNEITNSALLGRQKGSERIQINNNLTAVCLGILVIVLSISTTSMSVSVLVQLALAIPFFVTSSLAYSKTCYRTANEFRHWDTLGWCAHTLGYIAVINATMLLVYRSGFHTIAWIFLICVFALFIIYSIIDINLKPARRWEKLIKLGLYALLFFMGSIFPIAKGWN